MIDEIIEVIKKERIKQTKKWSLLHDDGHTDGELTDLACYYALADTNDAENLYPISWNYEPRKRDRKSRLEQLVIAAALIIAEIERLERKETLIKGY